MTWWPWSLKYDEDYRGLEYPTDDEENDMDEAEARVIAERQVGKQEELQKLSAKNDILRGLRLNGLVMESDCSTKHVRWACQLADEISSCAQYQNDPYWDDKKSATIRALWFILHELEDAVLNLSDFSKVFSSSLGINVGKNPVCFFDHAAEIRV